MDYFLLETAGDLNEQSLALVESAPEGMALHDYCLARGLPAKPHYPEDAKVFLPPESRGVKLPGILGNTKSFLIGSTKMKECVEKLCPGREIEYLAFTLYNQKKRVHSTDYFFINPVGGFDCLNEPACGIKYDPDGEVVVYKKLILDAKKMDDAPHLFRVHKVPTKYVVSKTLVQAFKDNGVTNLLGVKLKVA